ncbi:sn-glycerol-1-phosphate dehydrogenase [Cohnella endophytica]|uniref:sn-glycerol-1-phosphate dehydrogenase n=1 Tax=Cohnella endophytica TaxID=2419778 RepID=A0A494XWE8_9BACL|nr:sn-glycerol-1-phosphate dehydrogenase [Cohnella endophytica]RKP54004.1 sn-glycerol-1-phosphate dehydrogenase [Cohnella endophytica]
MSDLLRKVREAAKNCGCGHHHDISIELIDTEPGALGRAATYSKSKKWQTVGIVSDEVIYNLFGERLRKKLHEAGIQTELCKVRSDEQGDVVADEQAIVQVMVDIPITVDAYVVLGSGTLHDIVRFVSSRVGKPFVSVPTAPSVDGFTSAGAPIILRGFKQTIYTGAPVALFADPDIYGKAPQTMVAAGFGDMIGKHTSLFDWKFSHAVGGEAYCPATAALTRETLQWCEDAQESISAGSEEGVKRLMEALLLSGLAMLLFGASHPASGAEHHLSHDWEMELLRRKSKQLLHGAKVGVACAIIAEKYSEWRPDVELTGVPGLVEALDALPSSDSLRARLRDVGGPTTAAELGIEKELVKASLLRAHTHRVGRNTLLKRHNEGHS